MEKVDETNHHICSDLIEATKPLNHSLIKSKNTGSGFNISISSNFFIITPSLVLGCVVGLRIEEGRLSSQNSYRDTMRPHQVFFQQPQPATP